MYDLILITGFTKNFPGVTMPIGAMYNKLKDRFKVGLLIPDKIVNFDYDDIIPESKYYGISPYYQDWYYATKTIRNLKYKFPKSKIIVGGIFATAFPDYILKCEEVDYLCLGEGVYTMESILDGVDPLTIPNIKTKTKEGVVDIEEIADCPTLIKEEKDFIGPMKKRFTLTELLFTSRGCPHYCTFCTAPSCDYTSKIVRANLSALEEDIKYASKFEGCQELCLTSPNAWLPDKESDSFLRTVLNLVVKHKVYDKTIIMMMRSNNMIKEEFKKLIDSYPQLKLGFFIGIENFDDKVLYDFKKGDEGASAQDVYYNCFKEFSAKDNVKYIEGNILAGCPAETEETVKINKYWVTKIKTEITDKYPDKKLFFRAEPFAWLPGSEYHREIDKHKNLFVNEEPFLYNEDPIYNKSSVLCIKRDYYDLIQKREKDFTDFCHEQFG